MREEVFTDASHLATASSGAMTIRGTLQKTGILLAILVASAVVGWMFPNFAVMVGSFIVAFIMAIVIGFKPTAAPSLAPVYALIKGYAVGVISMVIQGSLAKSDNPIYANAVPVAILGTFVTLGVMLGLYSARIIRVTDTLRSVVIGATIAVGLTYLVSFIVGLMAPAFISNLGIFKSGPIGIAFSIFVIGLAAFNFLLDFDVIERGAESRAPRYMEWYAGFGLLVTIVWLYIEILNLLRKLAGNR